MSLSHYPSQEEGSWLSQGREIGYDRFLAIVQDNADIFLLLTPEGKLQEICSGWQDFTGQSAKKCFKHGWLNAFHPTDKLLLAETLSQSATTGTPAERMCHLRRGNGTWCLMQMRALPVCEASGATREIILYGKDMTQQELAEEGGEATTYIEELNQAETHLRQARKALHQSREELYFLTETIPQLVWVTRPDGFAEYFNRRWYEYTNAAIGEPLGGRWVNALHPDDRQRSWAVWNAAVQTGQPYEVEYRLREGKTGEYHWFLARGLPFTDEQGHVLKWFGTCTNIDEQKHIEEALQESELRFRRLMEANLIGIVIVDLEGGVYEANDAFLALEIGRAHV